MTENGNLLEIRNLKVYFDVRGAVLKAVDDVSLEIEAGETLGLVGESGCGKSVTASAVMGLVPSPPGRIEGGEIFFEGEDLVKLTESRMRKIRGNRVSMTFQESMTSLNPVYSVGDQVGEVLRLHRGLSRREAKDRVIEIFKLVGIPAPESRVKDLPHKLSGGMRQRVMIAMALACNPRLMIADEPTTALDVTIQAQILDLMNKLKEETNASILFITHDLGVIAEMAQRVAVLYCGRLVETASALDLFSDPKHPYTVGLLNSIPALNEKDSRRLKTIGGTVCSLFCLPEGCNYFDRCPDVMEKCRAEPPMVTVGKNHKVWCHKYG